MHVGWPNYQKSIEQRYTNLVYRKLVTWSARQRAKQQRMLAGCILMSTYLISASSRLNARKRAHDLHSFNGDIKCRIKMSKHGIFKIQNKFFCYATSYYNVRPLSFRHMTFITFLRMTANSGHPEKDIKMFFYLISSTKLRRF